MRLSRPTLACCLSLLSGCFLGPYPSEGMGGGIGGSGGSGAYGGSDGVAGSTGGVGGGGGFGGSAGGIGGGGNGTDADFLIQADGVNAYIPAPITGGTLLLALSGTMAVVSDTDRDCLWFIDLVGKHLLGKLELPVGSRPSRAVVDAAGLLHVVLRGTGKVAHVTVSTRTLLSSSEVCPEPRGIDYEPATQQLLVACEGGTLVRLSPTGARTAAALIPDLRDVIATSTGARVTTFRAASINDVSSNLTLAGISAVPAMRLTPLSSLEPGVAWRTVAGPGDTLVMAHQRRSKASITVSADAGGTNAYGSGSGGPPTCSPGAVSASLTVFNGSSVVGDVEFAGTLPVDVALTSDGGTFAVALAGSRSVVLGKTPTNLGAGCDTPLGNLPPGQYVAVAFTPEGKLIAQSRNPAFVLLYDPTTFQWEKIVYATDAVDTAGSLLFSSIPFAGGTQIACASCHPEAGEDGFVWTINGEPRRTQPLSGGISARAPYHWKGDQANLAVLMGDTFVRRMGGAPPSPAVVQSLLTWLDTVPAPRPSSTATPTELAAGNAAFLKAGCAACHGGARFTNNALTVVGTTVFKVPSLIGLQARAPYMHDGCAATLADRFLPACGGSNHGNAAVLAPVEFNALLLYLGSL